MPKRRYTKKKSKSIILDPTIWVKQGDVKSVREYKSKEQNKRCAISKHLLENPVLDHLHIQKDGNQDINPWQEEGRCRGVLESTLNMLEGRYLQLYNKANIQEKYGISFPDMLINMGEYLKINNSQEKFHYMYMNEMRKEVKRWNKNYLIKKLLDDFNLKVDNKLSVAELTQAYIQYWVYEVEKTY